jgi:uncharacterized membrane protein YbhN (UPF0104 family)
VGGIGFRYRLYSRLGLPLSTVTRILGLSLVTNWIGYFWLAGIAFSSGLVQLPEGWIVGNGTLRLIGFEASQKGRDARTAPITQG